MKTRKVCKDCLESGYDLVLNDQLLCFDCEDLRKFENVDCLSSDQRIEYIKKYELKKNREEKNYNYIFELYSIARQFEKNKDLAKALEIYLNLLEYCPPGTNYYNRPCIILEKRQEYSKAVEICDFAIKCIHEGRFQADEKEFNKRKERLIKKLENNKTKGG